MSFGKGVHRIAIVVKGLGVVWAALIVWLGSMGVGAFNPWILLTAAFGPIAAWTLAWIIEGFASDK